MADKIITIRLNEREQKQLEFVISHKSRYYREPVSSLIKRLIYNAFLECLEQKK